MFQPSLPEMDQPTETACARAQPRHDFLQAWFAPPLAAPENCHRPAFDFRRKFCTGDLP